MSTPSHSRQTARAPSRARKTGQCGSGIVRRGSRLASRSRDTQIGSALSHSHRMACASSRAHTTTQFGCGICRRGLRWLSRSQDIHGMSRLLHFPQTGSTLSRAQGTRPFASGTQGRGSKSVSHSRDTQIGSGLLNSRRMAGASSRARMTRRCESGMWVRGSRLVSHCEDIQTGSCLLCSRRMVSVLSRAQRTARCGFGDVENVHGRRLVIYTYQKDCIYTALTLFPSTPFFPYDFIIPTLHAVNFFLHTLHINIIGSLLSQCTLAATLRILRTLLYQTDQLYNHSDYSVYVSKIYKYLTRPTSTKHCPRRRSY